MEKFVLIISILFWAVVSLASASSFTLQEPSAEWMAIVDSLRKAERIQSDFEETRSNPFHRRPLRFEGTIRWDSELGLSIDYEKPSRVVVNITEQSMYVSKEDELRQLDSEGEQMQVMTLFSKLFAWDMMWLSENFVSSGEFMENSLWSLKLNPEDEDLSRLVTGLLIEGNADYITKIAMEIRGGRNITISLSDQDIRPCFSEQDIKEAFPYLND